MEDDCDAKDLFKKKKIIFNLLYMLIPKYADFHNPNLFYKWPNCIADKK